MINVCIYCGANKTKALHVCKTCLRAPNSHRHVIHSILLSFSETEPYRNFLTIEEIEDFRKDIIKGAALNINKDVLDKAEEAYSAVTTNNGPKAIQFFSSISVPIILVVIVVFLITISM